MSARISDEYVVYRSKRSREQFIDKPTHGATGWILDDGCMIQVNFFDKPGEPKGWLKLSDFKERQGQFRKSNNSFYQARPYLLRVKIRSRESSHTFPGCSYHMSRHSTT